LDITIDGGVSAGEARNPLINFVFEVTREIICWAGEQASPISDAGKRRRPRVRDEDGRV
jgi:hypothetical protein